MRGTINANFLANETIVIEDANEFNQSAFSAVYQKVKDTILTIIERNDKEYCKTKGNSLEETIENVVALEGRRGTGKTSVMRSIAETLKNSHKNDFLKNGDAKQKCSFIVSDYIDASSLEEGEDVLEMVLASMFSKLTESESGIGGSEYESRELYRLFDEVYKIFLDLRRNDRRSGNSPIQILAQVSNSHTLRKKFAELVSKYLNYMGQQDNRNYYNQKRFLVICIDDLDMRFDEQKDTSYHLLESLHRYLMLPGIILLLTYNYEDLLRGCIGHFRRECHLEHYSVHVDSDVIFPAVYEEKSQLTYEERLAIQYLNKVIPIYARVTMPSLRKMDYMEDDGAMISIDKITAEKVIGKLVKYFWEEDEEKPIEIPVKKFVLLMRAGTSGLYYDAKGRKRHFIEPKSMRELAQTYTFMKYLNTLHEENVMFKELLDDLYFRYAYEVLSKEERNKLDAFLEVPIGRRSQDIVNDIRKTYSEEWNVDISKITYVNKSKFSYSYGELLYCLYVASSKGIYSKEFIWCILESYTIMLTRLYRKLKNASGNDEEHNNYRDKLKEIMSDSLASSWSNEYLPKVHTLKDDGQKKLLEHNYMIIADEAVPLGAVRLDGTPLCFEFNFEDCKKNDGDIVLQTIELLLMFFTGIHNVKHSSNIGKGIKFKYVSVEDRISLGKKMEPPKFEMEIYADCFNIMNFIRNIFEGKDFFVQIRKNIINEFKKYFGEKITEQKLKDISLYSQKNVKEWYESNHEFAMPVYSFDMMYNIFKRLYTNQRHIPTEVQANKFWEYVRLIYKDIGDLLKEEDEYYFNGIDNAKKFEKDSFFHAFNTCPFIDYINDMYTSDKKTDAQKKKQEKRKNLFESNFSKMIECLYNSSIIRRR